MCTADLGHYLANNKNWVKNTLLSRPDYFNTLHQGQSPKALLLGCSDSRVSPSMVLGSDLGELFIHRNIANIVSHVDLNFLSVLQYAVEILEIRDIIVYGHYGCGGIKAAYADQANGLIDNWLANIKDVYKTHQSDLELIPNEEERLNKLVEYNVLAQLDNIMQTSIYKKAMKKGNRLFLHGWVFDIQTGLVKDLTQEYKDEKIKG